MQTLIHKPQGDPIKGFCLERAREGYSRHVQLGNTCAATSEEFEVIGPFPGPTEVEQVSIVRQGAAGFGSAMIQVYASPSSAVNNSYKGDIPLVMRAEHDGAFQRWIFVSLSVTPAVYAVKKKLFISPFWLVLHTRNLSGVAEAFYCDVVLKGIRDN